LNWFGLGESFWGALIGAILTGVSAIFVMGRQLVFQRKIDDRKRLEEYLKEARVLKYYLELLITSTKSFSLLVLENEDLDSSDPRFKNKIEENYGYAEMYYEDMEKYLNIINDIDHRYILEEMFQTYLEIKYICEQEVRYYSKRFVDRQTFGTGDLLNDAAEKLNQLKETLSKSIDSSEKRLSKLK